MHYARHEVLETVNLWMTGTKPMIRHWLHWDYNKLEPPNMRKDSIDKDANNQKNKGGQISVNLYVVTACASFYNNMCMMVISLSKLSLILVIA